MLLLRMATRLLDRAGIKGGITMLPSGRRFQLIFMTGKLSQFFFGEPSKILAVFPVGYKDKKRSAEV